jgi:sugar/nucleoside kinase (ribokinase family)
LDRPPRVGIAGDAGIDLTFRVSSGADEKAIVDQAERGLGGTGANAAVAAALLGSSVRMTGTVGDDAIGQWVLGALEAQAVGIDLMSTSAGRTEAAVVVIEDGSRRLFVDPGIGYRHRGDAILELRAWANVLYLTHVDPGLVEVAARGPGALVVVGMEMTDLDDGDWRRSLRDVDVVVTNVAGQRGVLAAVDIARTAVVITAGAAGATLLRDASQTTIRAPSVVAVDATGAGDCLAATLCNQLGIGHDVATALRLAVLAASLSTTKLGTQTAFPTAAELREFAAAQPVD